jgi:hypothetical protein
MKVLYLANLKVTLLSDSSSGDDDDEDDDDEREEERTWARMSWSRYNRSFVLFSTIELPMPVKEEGRRRWACPWGPPTAMPFLWIPHGRATKSGGWLWSKVRSNDRNDMWAGNGVHLKRDGISKVAELHGFRIDFRSWNFFSTWQKN